MRRPFAASVGVLALLVCAPGAGPITFGGAAGAGHPEVGALLAPQAFPDGTFEVCKGTLIARQVFLNAAHCDQGLSSVSVTFDSSNVYPTGTAFTDTWHADPAFNQAQSDPHDIAVVVL